MKKLLLFISLLAIMLPTTAALGAWQSDPWRTVQDNENCANPDSYWNAASGNCHYRFNQLYHYPLQQSWVKQDNRDLYVIKSVPTDGSWYCGLKSEMPAKIVVVGKTLTLGTKGFKIGQLQDVLVGMGFMKVPQVRGVVDTQTVQAVEDLLNL